jgi:hypothetical protein
VPNLSKHITENLVDSTTTQLTALSTVTATHKYQQTAPTVQPTSTMTSDLKRKWLSNDELLSEILGEIHPPPKKRRAIKKKPAILPPSNEPSHVDNTTFPFLNLPGEIRNMIYTYADLIDEDHSIRFETQTGRNGRNTVCRMFRARRGPPDRDDLPGQLKGSITKACTSYRRWSGIPQMSFPVHLFQVCKQLNNEASSIFYSGNMFVFEDIPQLHIFLLHFHHRVPLLRTLDLASVGANPSTPGMFTGGDALSSPLHWISPLLMRAVDLEALYLHTSIFQNFSGSAKIAAGRFYTHAHWWMHALALNKGNKLAGLDVIKMPALTTKTLKYPPWSTSRAGQDEFKLDLALKLTVQV